MSDGGKGWAQRPISNRKSFEENWNEIFGTSNNMVDKLPDPVGNPVRDMDMGKERGDCGGAQHSPENKPSK